MKSLIKRIKRTMRSGQIADKLAICFLVKHHFIAKSEIDTALRQRELVRINKKYGSFIKDNAEKNASIFLQKKPEKADKIIWFCWLQGLEKCPPIVKVCYDSVVKNNPDWKVICVSLSNVSQYVSFPEIITKKVKKGIITFTHFSDILRTALLVNYGGIWVDSTVLFTGPIPNFVFDSPVFLLKHSNSEVTFNSWFLFSKYKSDPIFVTQLEALYEYWKRENKNNYCLWHILCTYVAACFKDETSKILPFSDKIPELLSENIFNIYDQKFWNFITQLSSFHKLSNKYNIPKDIEGTYYEKICVINERHFD